MASFSCVYSSESLKTQPHSHLKIYFYFITSGSYFFQSINRAFHFVTWKMGDPYGQWSSRATKLENTIWAIRLLLICIGIASCVALLKAAVIPYASTFIVDTILCIWNSGKVLFSPPYVYIIVNCIIIAIAASTSFHHQNHLSRKPERTTPSQKSQVLETEFTEKDEAMAEETVEVIKPMITESYIVSNTSDTTLDRNPLTPPSAALSGNLSKNSWSTLCDRATLEEPGKNFPESEDGKLPDEKEDDTMDSIWKAIMEGQGKQPTAQLKKSYTWETAMNATVGSIVTKEKSMGQDELKLRIEAFIWKNYNDMRLQREESERQFVEMVNGGIVR